MLSALHAPAPASPAGWGGAALPGVWRASELAGPALHTLSSGHPALDQALPGGGWPCASLTELLQAQPGLHEWRLLLPALRRAAQNGPLVLIAPPHLPNLAALACLGIAAALVLRVEAHTPAERLWAAEQALRCRELGALLAWLPQARPEQLRRLHLSAQSAAPATAPAPSPAQPAAPLVFVFRPLAAQHESSPAPLRLTLRGLGCEGLELNLIKRRGPALDQPLCVAAAYPLVAALVRQPESRPPCYGSP